MELTKTADTNTSPVTALTTMIYDPMRAFAMLEHRRAAWFPLLLVMVCSLGMLTYYYSVVDFAWLQEQMFATVADAEAREKAKAFMTKTAIMTSSLLGGAIAFPAMCAITGLYLMIAGKVVKAPEFTFGKGFALAAWASVPVLLTSILGVMQLVMSSNGQLDFSALNPLSVNQLFFKLPMGATWASFYDTLNIGTILNIILMVCGFQVWAKVRRSTAIIVSVLPYVIVMGIWAAYNMSKAA